MKKLRPLTPTSTQIERVKKCAPGEGFFIFHACDDSVQVVEFSIAPDGAMLNRHGAPLEYALGDGATVYRVESKTRHGPARSLASQL